MTKGQFMSAGQFTRRQAQFIVETVERPSRRVRYNELTLRVMIWLRHDLRFAHELNCALCPAGQFTTEGQFMSAGQFTRRKAQFIVETVERLSRHAMKQSRE